jgi:hypothetical protein
LNPDSEMVTDHASGLSGIKRGLHASGLVWLLLFLLVSACASIPVKPIPEPPFTAKLRVMVLTATSSQPRTHWGATDEEFARAANFVVGSILQQKGIYEVVPQSDIDLTLGDQKIQGWQWVMSDWALAREVGKAVHADYLFTVERGASGLLFWRMALINTGTGKQYTAANHVVKQQDSELSRQEFRSGVRNAYRDIFQLAQSDLFETAVKRTRIESGKSRDDMKQPPGKASMPPSDQAKTARTPETKIADKAPLNDQDRDAKNKAARKSKPGIAEKAPVNDPDRDAMVEMARKPESASKSRVIVYDFQAIKHLEIPSLILSEALREEIYKNSRFVLISREDLQKVMDEIKLQQSGFVDERQAVQLGNWLAANEVVTGKLGTFGNTCVLSVKRTDMNTMAALGMESLKCPVGKEEDLLAGIPEIAKKLTGR